MDTLFAVVAQAVAFVDRDKFNPLGRFADGDDGDGFIWELQRFADGFPVEIADHQSAEAHLHGFEQHALQGDAEVDVDTGILRHRAADYDEGLRLGAGKGQMQLRESPAHADVGVDGVGFRPLLSRYS